ncbi:hypothetical protein BESB_079710 [Besnoitia besnoiti]|uniref:THH1/TOM1/TOM3 domain-containing protein n=1 Tax=Besnoitia besnoiti TaxID=94643 RepID=A0A2A9M6Y1_BESBE|nr:hypothetical protein BESB_079710 [Besnoitia besnoiti]PFH33755.1 hypothetical protein BESB_079710 [Besnoitia besnoiti]
MTGYWTAFVSLISSAPALLGMAGVVFLVLDCFAVYQLKKIYCPSSSGPAPAAAAGFTVQRDDDGQGLPAEPHTDSGSITPRTRYQHPHCTSPYFVPPPGDDGYDSERRVISPLSPEDEGPLSSFPSSASHGRQHSDLHTLASSSAHTGDEGDGERAAAERARRSGVQGWTAWLKRWRFPGFGGLSRFRGSEANAGPTLALPPSLTGGQTRSAFMLLLSAAIFARAVSLFVMAWIVAANPAKEPAEPLPLVTPSSLASPPLSFPLALAESLALPGSSASSSCSAVSADVADDAAAPAFRLSLDCEWLLLFLDSAPSLIFFSALSLIILFWAKIYYAVILVAYPRLEKGPWLCSGGLLAFFLLFFSMAVLLQAKRSATRALQIATGLLFALAAGAFFVYGTKVAKKLSERGKAPSRKKSIVRRVLFLALVCPVLFTARTILALRGHTPPASPLRPSLPPTWHSQPLVEAALIYLVTEWVPALFILVTFWHRKSRAAGVRSHQQRQLMQMHDHEREHSLDSTVAAPLMQQSFYPLLSPPAYVQSPALYDLKLQNAGAQAPAGACVTGNAQDGLIYQSYVPPYPLPGGNLSGGYAMPHGPYYQQYYPPPTL